MKGFLVISMLFAYAAGACPDSWTSHGGNCYLFSHDEENWASAMIGLTDLSEEGSYVWMTSGAKITSEAFTNWENGQPDNAAHNENCVHYRDRNGEIKWNDYPCARLQQYICEQNSDAGIPIIG